MVQINESKIVYRLLSGNIYIGDKYILKSPTVDTLYKSTCIYENYLSSRLFDEPEIDIERLSGVVDFENKKNQMLERISDLKIEMYEQHLNPEILCKLRRQLDAVKNGLNLMYNKRYSYEHITPEGAAKLLQEQYIIANSLFFNNGNRVFSDDFDNINFCQLNDIMLDIN